MLAMAAAIVGNVVERGTDRMVNRNLNDGLPAFLVSNPGLNSGFMIPQYTAAGLMNEIKHLATPATIDSISTCANQEDPVSMAYYASKKALASMKKLQYVTAIEIYTALQAMDFLKPLEPSPVLGKLRDFVRKTVPFVDNDRYLYPDIAYITDRVRDCTLVDLVENEIGALEF
jgi:histidine ammonia-lyase